MIRPPGAHLGLLGRLPEWPIFLVGFKLRRWSRVGFGRWELVIVAFSATFLSLAPPVVARSPTSRDSFGPWLCFIHLSPQRVNVNKPSRII